MLYYIPGAKSVSKSVLEEERLESLVQATGRQAREVMNGPEGAGLLITDGYLPAERVTFKAEEQVWSRRYGMRSYVGHWKDDPPGPMQLARGKQLPGVEVVLLDGNPWKIPVLRKWSQDDSITWTTNLPRVMQQSMDDGRMMLGDVIPQYQEIWNRSLDIAQQLFDGLQGKDTADLDDQEAERFCMDLLAINYRVDTSVISHLQLLSGELMGQVVCAALDWDTLRASLKNLLSRQASGGTNSASGVAPPSEA